MHVILGLLGSIITILWLLHRLAEMGIDLGGLNPWLWRRRRKWRALHDANPVFKLSEPMEVTALLLTAIAKADGEMSSVEKSALLGIFERDFHLSKRDAAGLLISSAHLLGKGEEVREKLDDVLRPSRERFSTEQSASALSLFERMASADGPPSGLQQELLVALQARFAVREEAPRGPWN